MYVCHLFTAVTMLFYPLGEVTLDEEILISIRPLPCLIKCERNVNQKKKIFFFSPIQTLKGQHNIYIYFCLSLAYLCVADMPVKDRTLTV